MSKNGIIGLSAAAIAVLGGLTLYTNSAFSSQVKEVITTFESNKAQVTLVNDEQGMLGGSAQYKVTFNQEIANEMGMESSNEEEMSFFINHAYSSYPLYVSSKITLDFSQGAPKKFIDKLDADTIEHLLTIDTNLLTQSQSTNLVVKPTELKDKDGSLMSSGKVSLVAKTDLGFSKGDVDLALEKINLDMGDNGIFNLTSLASSASIDNLDGMIMAKDSVVALKSISFVKDAHQIDMAMKDLAITSHYNDLSSDALSGTSVLGIKSINFSNAMTKYDIVDTTMDMTVNNIDRAGLIALDKASKDASNPQAIMEAATLMLARGIDGSVNKLSTSVNDVKIDSHGKFDWPAYEGDNLQAEMSMHFVKLFAFDYSANLSKNYAEVFPQYAPMVDMMVAQGFATADADGNLSTEIVKKDMAITANGKRIR